MVVIACLFQWQEDSLELSVPTLSDIPAILNDDIHFIGVSGTMAIKSDNSLWALGLELTKVLDDVAQVSMGNDHTMAIKKDGSLWVWGNHRYGQLGDGTETDRPTPVKIMDDVVQVSASGNCTMAIKTNGSFWAWGNNNYGQLGDGTKTNRSTPVKIMSGVVQISAGAEHTMAIKKDGSLWASGRNDESECGDSTTKDRAIPVKVMDDVAQVSAGTNRTMVIKKDGSLWVWGFFWNHAYPAGAPLKLFRGSARHEQERAAFQSIPVKIMDDVVQVTGGEYYTMVIKSDGSLWAWGYYGQNYENAYGWVDWKKSGPMKIDA
jgi:alpha-tubulin suppressor-like RCC1 family protein